MYPDPNRVGPQLPGPTPTPDGVRTPSIGVLHMAQQSGVLSRTYTVEVAFPDGRVALVGVPFEFGPTVVKVVQAMAQQRLTPARASAHNLAWTRWNTPEGVRADELALHTIRDAVHEAGIPADTPVKGLGRVIRTTVELVSPWVTS